MKQKVKFSNRRSRSKLEPTSSQQKDNPITINENQATQIFRPSQNPLHHSRKISLVQTTKGSFIAFLQPIWFVKFL